jgi:energy-coupling factor transport system permease protein
MRSPLAYTPRSGLLQSASAAAAIVYLGSFILTAFLFSSPFVLAGAGVGAALAGLIAGARRAVIASVRLSLTLAILIVFVNGLVTDRGETVLARLGDWPLLGQVNVTAEALAAGAVVGLRAMVTMIAFGVYSACVDPDRVMRLLRPLAGRSALTATLISRLVPVAAADAARLREAAELRGPGAAPVGRAAIARRLLAGSLDRAVDVAATLELRGYGLRAPRAERRRDSSRHDRRFFATGVAISAAAIAVEAFGSGGFRAYPTIVLGTAPETLALALALALAGLAPLRRRPRTQRSRHKTPLPKSAHA